MVVFAGAADTHEEFQQEVQALCQKSDVRWVTSDEFEQEQHSAREGGVKRQAIGRNQKLYHRPASSPEHKDKGTQMTKHSKKRSIF
eukprot:5954811-Amphidinium_carterae.1